MKVKVLKEFREEDDFAKAHKEGDVIDVNEGRAEKLKALGLVEGIVGRPPITPNKE